jgi:hypothetical protein
MAVEIDVNCFVRYGQLVAGLLIMVSGIIKVVDVFDLPEFHFAFFVWSLSLILFGLLIAQTFKPIGFVNKWFAFMTVPVGRACFEIWCGLIATTDDFNFQTVGGVIAIIIGIVYLALACLNKLDANNANAPMDSV